MWLTIWYSCYRSVLRLRVELKSGSKEYPDSSDVLSDPAVQLALRHQSVENAPRSFRPRDLRS